MPKLSFVSSTAMSAAAISALLALPAHAQLVDHPAARNHASYVQSERTVAIGISLPLGRQRRDAAPRIDLHLQRNLVGADGLRTSPGPGTGALRISRSIDRQPQWFINQQRVTASDQRQGVSTLGVVGIAVAAVLVIGVVAVAADPPLNDLFEED